MKGSTFLIIGGIVVVGAVAYEVYKHFCKPTNEECKKEPVVKDDFHTAHNAFESDFFDTHTASAADVYETRETIVQSVRERHSEAAKAMEESLITIFSDSENDEIVTENSENLRETSSKLGDLLK